MKKLVLCVAFPLAAMAQNPVGQMIIGDNDDDRMGQSCALSNDGSILAIGSSYHDGAGADAGMVRVYTNMGGTWTAMGNDINGLVAGDRFGTSMSISGDGNILAVATPFSDVGGNNTGQVRVFEYSNNNWIQKGSTLNGMAANDAFGTDVALSDDGTHLVVGGPYNDGNASNSGHARVYQFTNGEWAQVGADIQGKGSNNNTGESVAISADGSTVAVGSPANGTMGSFAGLARVFKYTNGSWTQQGADIYGQNAGDWSGESVELSYDDSVVMIAGRSAGAGAGQIRLFTYSNNTWTQKGSDLNGEAAGDFSGWSTSLSANGNIVAIGAVGNDGNGQSSGHVRVYSFFGTDWIQVGADIDGAQANDACGSAASLSADGTILAVGTYRYGIPNDTVKPGSVQVWDLTTPLANRNEVATGLAVYPQPAVDFVNIETTSGTLESVSLYNTRGEHVLTSYEAQLKLQDIASGLYILQLETSEGVYRQKLIIQ
ncbi:MAG TPA: hypothetical protein DIU20_02645 [Cryomorphaceae bacterium]|nr:hypothetical protein [Cryomorphaceae bacterium]